jgi:hypothetical protein
MTCPECGAQMWNYEPETMRCDRGHVFAIEALEGVQAKVVRVDRPSMRERLTEFAVGVITGGTMVAVVVVLVDKL